MEDDDEEMENELHYRSMDGNHPYRTMDANGDYQDPHQYWQYY